MLESYHYGTPGLQVLPLAFWHRSWPTIAVLGLSASTLAHRHRPFALLMQSFPRWHSPCLVGTAHALDMPLHVNVGPDQAQKLGLLSCLTLSLSLSSAVFLVVREQTWRRESFSLASSSPSYLFLRAPKGSKAALQGEGVIRGGRPRSIA